MSCLSRPDQPNITLNRSAYQKEKKMVESGSLRATLALLATERRPSQGMSWAGPWDVGAHSQLQPSSPRRRE